MRVLLVEDDLVIAQQIVKALAREGYIPIACQDGETGVREAAADTFGLVILDVMLPLRDGWSVCEQIRKSGSSVPILMLTARDSVEDRVKGLEGGADDYLPKPFDVRELLARVRALLRRDKVHRTGLIQIGDLEIDSNAHTVKRGGRDVRLTPREYALLEALARNEGRTLTREVILESVWDNEESMEGTVNFHVASLRKKIDDGSSGKLIHTVHGFGYCLKAGAG